MTGAVRRASRARDLLDIVNYPTVEELFVTGSYQGTITAGSTVFVPVFTAPYPLKVRGITGANYGGDLTLDGSNYWSFRPRRYRVLTDFTVDFQDVIGSSGTNYALDASKEQGLPWPFEPRAKYSDTYSLFASGDSLVIRIASSGSPTSLSNLLFTVRVEPL